MASPVAPEESDPIRTPFIPNRRPDALITTAASADSTIAASGASPLGRATRSGSSVRSPRTLSASSKSLRRGPPSFSSQREDSSRTVGEESVHLMEENPGPPIFATSFKGQAFLARNLASRASRVVVVDASGVQLECVQDENGNRDAAVAEAAVERFRSSSVHSFPPRCTYEIASLPMTPGDAARDDALVSDELLRALDAVEPESLVEEQLIRGMRVVMRRGFIKPGSIWRVCIPGELADGLATEPEGVLVLLVKLVAVRPKLSYFSLGYLRKLCGASAYILVRTVKRTWGSLLQRWHQLFDESWVSRFLRFGSAVVAAAEQEPALETAALTSSLASSGAEEIDESNTCDMTFEIDGLDVGSVSMSFESDAVADAKRLSENALVGARVWVDPGASESAHFVVRFQEDEIYISPYSPSQRKSLRATRSGGSRPHVAVGKRGPKWEEASDTLRSLENAQHGGRLVYSS